MAETDFTGGVKSRPKAASAKAADLLTVPSFRANLRAPPKPHYQEAVATKRTNASAKAFARVQQIAEQLKLQQEEAALPHDMFTEKVRRVRTAATKGVQRLDPSHGQAATQRKRAAAKKKAVTAPAPIVERPATQAFDIGKFFENLTKLGDHNEDIKLGALDHYYIPKIYMLLARLQVARDLAQQRRAALTNDGDELANMFASTRLGGKRRR